MYAEVALKRKTDHGADEDIELPAPSDCGTMNKTNFHQLEVSLYAKFTGQEYAVISMTECSCFSLVEALAATVGAYYTFNMEYPLSLKPVLVFVEKVLVDASNSEKIPISVNRLYSALGAVTLDVLLICAIM